METTEFIIRMLVATGVGAAVGLERQINNKSAGLRTNTLVALGSCVFVIISVMLIPEGGDPTRIIGQVVTGIGFLGAGVILHRGANVEGLTTAATIWCSAGLGCLAGLENFLEAAIAAIFIIIINFAFKKGDKWFDEEQKKLKKNNDKSNQ
ncbi:MAG: MgtC/SapB family protein [Dysgonamonadaceae bacterium]